MTKEFYTYIEITEKCAAQCEVMLNCEQEKRQALLADDMKRLEAVLQNQQSAVMTLEVLEKRRMEAQVQAGHRANATASEVLEAMEESAGKDQLGMLIGRLGRTAEDLRALNKTAIDIARSSLQLFSHLSQATKIEERPTYRPGAYKGTGWTGGSAFEQKV